LHEEQQPSFKNQIEIMEEADIKIDYEIFENPESTKGSRCNISVDHVKRAQISSHSGTSIYMKSTLFILVLNGSITFDLNFKEYVAGKDSMILLSFGHFMKIKHVGEDFECVMLYVGKNYVDQMYSSEMIYKRVKYGVRMHGIPVLLLDGGSAPLLKRRLEFLEEIIGQSNHRHYEEMILHSLELFFLDLGNIIEGEYPDTNEQNISRDEIYFQKFLELLVEHYRKEHLVDFYAGELHITPHYLTLIVKRLSGQTVSDFIFQLLYSEAKTLLKQPDLPVQQIASALYFSDQSAFGKFFKRKCGVSPKDFRASNYAS